MFKLTITPCMAICNAKYLTYMFSYTEGKNCKTQLRKNPHDKSQKEHWITAQKCVTACKWETIALCNNPSLWNFRCKKVSRKVELSSTPATKPCVTNKFLAQKFQLRVSTCNRSFMPKISSFFFWNSFLERKANTEGPTIIRRRRLT